MTSQTLIVKPELTASDSLTSVIPKLCFSGFIRNPYINGSDDELPGKSPAPESSLRI